MPAADPAGRLLLEGEPHGGVWNMAFDEALLDAAAERGQVALRVYRWSEPTLSLGYFQKSLPPDLPEPLRRLPAVRRLSGGGAILHHLEWTYSVALPKTHPLARRTERLYEEVHAALIGALARYGVAARLRGESDAAANAAFLCFERGDARDVTVAGHKVAGSAQRRRRGAVLQHGSVLLRRSPLAAGLPGLFDLAAGLPEDPLFAAAEFVEGCRPLLFADGPAISPHPSDLARARDLAGGDASGEIPRRHLIDTHGSPL